MLLLFLAITLVTTTVPGFRTEAKAFDQQAFFGGMLAGHVASGAIRRSRMRTAAVMHQAYSQPRVVHQQAPAAAPAPAPAAATPHMTVKQKLDQLDKLAAGGYITPEEYKAKKKAILNSM
jgi:hypothetical protein